MQIDEMIPNGKTPLFYLGALAEQACCELETYERLAVEAHVVDLTDPQADE